MRRKLYKLALLFALILTALIVFPNFDEDVSAVSANSEYEVSIDAKYYIAGGYAWANDSGAVTFTISISKAPDEDVDVYYETRDKSAIASLGDYTEKSSFATIPKNKTSVDIVINTSRSEFAVMDPSGIIYSREFEVVLTDVVGLKDFKYGKQSANGMVGYNFIYRTKVANQGSNKPILYFEDYNHVDVSAPMTTDEIDGDGEVSVNYNFSETALYSHWNRNFISNGLASLYATYKGKIDDWGLYTYWSYAELLNANGIKIVGLKSEGYYDMEDLNPNNFGHTNYKWYNNRYSFTSSQTHYVEELCCDCKNDLATNDMHCYFYKVDSEPNYTLTYRSEGGRDRKLVDTSIYSTLIDTQAAKLEGNRFYATSLTKVGDKLRVAIRFSEPVYVVNDMFSEYGLEKSTIKLVANQNLNYTTELTYAGGNYTDTLFYEVEYDKIIFPNEPITSFMYFGGNGIVHDFAFNTAKEKGQEPYYVNNTMPFNMYSTSLLKVDADLRVPNVSFSVENNKAILKQHSVTVNISNVNLDDSKLYYSWEETDSSIGLAIKQKNYYGSALDINTITGGGYTGKRYLHVYIETKYGKTKYAVYDTALSFDNTAPSLTVDSVIGSYKSRVFDITVSDNFSDSDSGIKSVYMYYRGELELEYNIVEIKSYIKKVYDDTFSFTLNAGDLGISNTGFSYINLGFYAEDNLGNKLQIDYSQEYDTYLFDNGNSMLCLYESINEDKGHNLLVSNYYDTFMIKKNPDEDLQITFINFDVATQFGDMTPILEGVYEVKSGKKVAAQSFNVEDDSSKVVVELNPTDSNGEFLPGYYQLRFYIEILDEKYYSQYFYLYISEGKETETTTNYLELNNQYVLNNYVYQLSLKYPNYYYVDITGALQKVPYATASKGATFSSYDKAYQYIYMKELLDLYGKKITAQEADYLNKGLFGTYRKADGEYTVAKEGQIWIRYKRVNWDFIDQETSWVWYCYNESTSNPTNFTLDITVGFLPDLLEEALTTVSTKIAKNGEYIYLVGSEHTDKNGAPKLDANQIHIKPETYYQTNCGTPFGYGSYAAYSGDPKIVNSIVTYNNEEHYLATNFTLVSETYTLLYYRPAGSDLDYQKLVYKPGMTYSQAIAANGLFDILEAGTQGIKEYQVYIDREAPVIELSYVDTLGISQKIALNDKSNGSAINARMISIDKISSDADNLSYILLYKASNLKLLDVITFEELKTKPYVLENDHYIAYVYDRSGNFYTINIRINDTDLNCIVKEQENEYIILETNREANQIQYFEVYLDGDLIANVFSPSLKFSKSGLYQINIRDWYGNSDRIEYNFELLLPSVEWKYEIDGQVYNYTEDNIGMKMVKLSDNEYFILSKGLLQFTVKNGYGYEFVGDVHYTHSYINNRVKIKETTKFTVKIYYINNPHIYVTYNISFDESAPDISASYIEREYVYEELQYFANNISQYQQGEILVPESLAATIKSSKFNVISNGQVFQSDLISVKFHDNSGLFNVKVYLDGALLREIVYGEEFGEIFLSSKGCYKIVVTDVLGNVKELSFTNQNINNHQFEIDSESNTYSDSVLYGHESIKVKLVDEGEITYLINCDGNIYHLSLLIKDGVVYRSYYFVGLDDYQNNTLCVDDTDVLFAINENTQPNVYYDLASNGFKFEVMYDSDNNITIIANLVDDKIYDYECRVVDKNNIPFIYVGSLSSKKSDVILIDYQNNQLVTNQDGQYIYLSKSFSVDDTQSFEKINYIKAYHSNGTDAEISQYVFKDNELLIFKFTDDGIYRIEIKDVYGNITTYHLAMSNTFIITSKVIDKEGKEVVYSKDYNEKLYSNDTILLTAFSDNLTYQVTKDGKVYKPTVDEKNGQTILTLSTQGSYVVEIEDLYGNKKTIIAEIKSSNLIYDENLIYGFSEKAQKDYTNKKLSINHSLFNQYGISYVSVLYQDEEYILYDLINENEIEFNLSSFEECIGFDGHVGIYTVVFKDIYGNVMKKNINYSDSSTLNLSRTTRSDSHITYDLELALADGFWSNMELNFDSISKNYIFKVNNETLHLPYVLNFDNLNMTGEIHYMIYYLDEYGFEYEFDAILCMQDIEIKVLNTDVIVIDDMLTTKTNIELSVDEETTITYTIDGGITHVYQGEPLYKDGIYRIEVTDKAGNIEAVTIKKDTYVYYEFYDVGKNQSIINGEIINSNNVKFKVLNTDTSYIEKVFLNGSLLPDYNSVIFAENGKWEFIISDKIGNKSYFTFYQILKTMKSFDYETPEYYKITEIQYDSGNGVNVSYMNYIQQNDKNSLISLTENGKYKVKMTSILNNSSKMFEVKIDSSAPEITLIGCEENGSTKEDVTIQGYSVGDTVYVYKNGKLVSKTYISSKVVTPPIIKDGGEYEIIVESEAGVRTIINFHKDFIANTAGSVLITVLILTTVCCLFAGLILRNKLKVDH